MFYTFQCLDKWHVCIVDTIHHGSKSLKAYASTSNATVNWMKQFSCNALHCADILMLRNGCEQWADGMDLKNYGVFELIVVNHAGETCGMWIVRIFWFDGCSKRKCFAHKKVYKILAIMFAICLAYAHLIEQTLTVWNEVIHVDLERIT